MENILSSYVIYYFMNFNTVCLLILIAFLGDTHNLQWIKISYFLNFISLIYVLCFAALYRTRFCKLSTVDTLGWRVPCCGGCPVHCTMFTSIPGLYPLDQQFPQSCDNQNWLQTLSNVPWEAKLPPVETHRSRISKTFCKGSSDMGIPSLLLILQKIMLPL